MLVAILKVTNRLVAAIKAVRDVTMYRIRQYVPWLLAAVSVMGVTNVAWSQPTLVSAASTPIQLQGTSGGSQRHPGCAGFIAAAPNHQVQIKDNTNLNFVLNAAGGSPTLLLRSSSGQEYCVASDNNSAQVQLPGFWLQGLYSVYVGDRGQARHTYNLSIVRN